MRSEIIPGIVFPDYELPDHTTTPRRLSELQGDDHMSDLKLDNGREEKMNPCRHIFW